MTTSEARHRWEHGQKSPPSRRARYRHHKASTYGCHQRHVPHRVRASVCMFVCLEITFLACCHLWLWFRGRVLTLGWQILNLKILLVGSASIAASELVFLSRHVRVFIAEISKCDCMPYKHMKAERGSVNIVGYHIFTSVGW